MSAKNRELQRLLRLSGPIIVAQVSMMMMGVVDTIMVGHVGVKALGGVALGHIWSFGSLMSGVGLIYGIDPVVTHAFGSGNARRMALGLQRGLVVAVLVSVPIALAWVFTDPGLRLFGQDPELTAIAERYVWVQIPSIPVFLCFFTLRQYLQGRGIVRPTMVIAVIANAYNVLFNWMLIFGHGGVPPLGPTGAGIATALTRLGMLLTLIAAVRMYGLHRGAWVPWSRDTFAWRGVKEILGYGLPVSLQISLEMWAFQISTLMAGRLGTIELAAHTIVLNVASLSFMIPLGISMGSVTRVGNLLGAGRTQRAQIASWSAFALGAGVMIASAIAFVVLRFRIPGLYTDDVAVVAMSASIFPIAAAFQLFDGTQVVGGGILRGMGRTRPAAVFNLFGYYVLALPLAWFFAFHQGLGLAGIWWGLCLGLAVIAMLLLLWNWRRGPGHLDPEQLKAAAARLD